jgi:hypothetical protein
VTDVWKWDELGGSANINNAGWNSELTSTRTAKLSLLDNLVALAIYLTVEMREHTHGTNLQES